MNPSAFYDIHVASDVMPAELEADLNQLGFGREAFLRGTPGIARPHHFSVRTRERTVFAVAWDRLRERLARAVERNEFFGYAEAEVTSAGFVCRLPNAPFTPGVPFPFDRFAHEPCTGEQAKEADIHYSAVLGTMDPRLEEVLETAGFYHVDVRKSPERVVRVYTFQTIGVRDVAQLYRALRDYLVATGGAEGKLKLEATIGFARYPNWVTVPPVIRSSPRHSHALAT